MPDPGHHRGGDEGMGVLGLHGRRNFVEHCLEPVRVSDGTRLRTDVAGRQQLIMVIHLDRAGVVTHLRVDSPS